MMLKGTKVIGLIVALTISNVWAQCPAPEKMVKASSKSKETWGVNSQSKAGALITGQSYEMSFIAQPDYDYRITTGTANADKGEVSFEVYEMISEKDDKGQYKKVKKVLISSADAESKTVEFTTDKGRKLMISVTFEGSDEDNKKPECVAVLIEDKKTTKIGY
ncbi:MAG: hypothetical protein K0R65_2934 [Crocinitomicaceae bacterium]|jgi:hypothetical protein|nr:hypothetical protein [Crocinitomicaceae bacterium]